MTGGSDGTARRRSLSLVFALYSLPSTPLLTGLIDTGRPGPRSKALCLGFNRFPLILGGIKIQTSISIRQVDMHGYLGLPRVDCPLDSSTLSVPVADCSNALEGPALRAGRSTLAFSVPTLDNDHSDFCFLPYLSFFFILS